jgi:hypothetical protein
VEVVVDHDRLPLRVDGVARGDVDRLTVEVVPGALRLLL